MIHYNFISITGIRMIGHFFARTAGRTAQDLINAQNFYKGIAQTSASIFASGASAAGLYFIGSPLSAIFAGGAILQNGAIAHYATGRFFNKKIDQLTDIRNKFDQKNKYFATADLKNEGSNSSISEDWTNIAITDKDGLEAKTTKVIEGDNKKLISDPFTLQALLKEVTYNHDQSGYEVVGTQIQESLSQLMNRIDDSSGIRVYTNETAEDQLIGLDNALQQID